MPRRSGSLPSGCATGNLGTMLRTGDAVGAGELILLDESTVPMPSRQCARA
jgi:tRNA G18 (ribose-2'-O)-methylase SpoU